MIESTCLNDNQLDDQMLDEIDLLQSNYIRESYIQQNITFDKFSQLRLLFDQLKEPIDFDGNYYQEDQALFKIDLIQMRNEI